MAIWLLSDFHSELLFPHKACRALESFAFSVKEHDASPKVLFIAGDLGNPRSETFQGLLETLKRAFDTVIGVAGNHEYYRVMRDRVSISQIDDHLHAVYAKAGCTFLQCEETQLFDGRRVLGATLWSNIDRTSFYSLNDSEHVFADISEYLYLHKTHTSYLENSIGATFVPLVITHHLPTFKAIHPIYRCKSCNDDETTCKDGISRGFASDLDHLIARSEMWFCGHTHESYYTPGVITNPYGYEGEGKLSKWSDKPVFSGTRNIKYFA